MTILYVLRHWTTDNQSLLLLRVKKAELVL